MAGGQAENVISITERPASFARAPSVTTSSAPWLSPQTAISGLTPSKPKTQFSLYGFGLPTPL